MSDTFDAYHQWLGIPPGEQPPNAYRLLGLRLLESDTEVIQNAADRQMLHLRTYQLGQHAEVSERLLNEVAAARLLLLNPAKKAEYDRQLSAEQKPTKYDPTSTSEPTASGEPALLEVPRPANPVVLTPVPKRRAKRLMRRTLPILTAIALIGTSIILLSYAVSSFFSNERPASSDNESGTSEAIEPTSETPSSTSPPTKKTPDEPRPTIVIESPIGRPAGPRTSTGDTTPKPKHAKDVPHSGQEAR